MENDIRQLTYTNEIFRENLEVLIKEFGVTKKRISEDLDIGEINLSRLCKKENDQKPSIDILMKISKYFNITIDELIGESIREKRKQKRVISERKDIKFCEKLIKETHENLIVWQKYNRMGDSEICDEILGFNPDDSSQFYTNKDLGIDYNANNINIVYAKINDGDLLRPRLEICILKIPFEIENENLIYEIYFKKEGGEVIKATTSWTDEYYIPEIDNEVQHVIERLYNEIDYYICFGKERFERDKIFDDYLNERTIYEDLPF